MSPSPAIDRGRRHSCADADLPAAAEALGNQPQPRIITVLQSILVMHAYYLPVGFADAM
jgi:hypothetical protein